MVEENLEGKIISGGSLSEYETYLHFDRELLRGKKILNFGSGGSNLGKDLRKDGIEASLIDLDLRFDPISQSSIGVVAEPFIEIVDLLIEPESDFHKSLVNLKRTLGDIKGRTILQGDGRFLPFADKTFDIVLSLKTTYQIPNEARKSVYKELMRVGKVLHCAPVLKSDFHILSGFAEENDYEVIYSGPPLAEEEVDEHFSDLNDYEHFKKRFSKEERISEPPDDDIKVSKLFGVVLGATFNGAVMILKRKEGTN